MVYSQGRPIGIIKESQVPRKVIADDQRETAMVTINVPLPVDLHRRLRVKQIMRDLQMKDAVAEAIEQWVAT